MAAGRLVDDARNPEPVDRDEAVDIGVIAEQRLHAAQVAEAFFPESATAGHVDAYLALTLVMVSLLVTAFAVSSVLRAHGEEMPALVRADGAGFEVVLDRPARGVAPGQAAVLYEGSRVVGSGTIVRDPG